MSLIEDIEKLAKEIDKLQKQLEQKKALLKQDLVSKGEYSESITPKMKQSLVTINKWLGEPIPQRCYYDKVYCHRFIGKYLKQAVKKSREFYKEKNNL